jgi:hypothetical protein
MRPAHTPVAVAAAPAVPAGATAPHGLGRRAMLAAPAGGGAPVALGAGSASDASSAGGAGSAEGWTRSSATLLVKASPDAGTERLRLDRSLRAGEFIPTGRHAAPGTTVTVRVRSAHGTLPVLHIGTFDDYNTVTALKAIDAQGLAEIPALNLPRPATHPSTLTD